MCIPVFQTSKSARVPIVPSSLSFLIRRGRSASTENRAAQPHVSVHHFWLSRDACVWHARNHSLSSSRQVYRPQSHDWLIEDKEWGKSLIAKSMLLAIALFFFDGNSFRLDVLEIVLEKLLNLRDIVRRVRQRRENEPQSNWRFWSSSFLFTYEGEGETRADVHLIDFGNCNFSDCYDTPDEVGLGMRDEGQGCILALSNMIAYIRLIQNGAVGLSEIRRFEASL